MKITDEVFKKNFEAYFETEKEMLLKLKNNEELIPKILVLEKKQDKYSGVLIVLSGFGKNKQAEMESIGNLVATHQITPLAVIFSSEAWFASGDKGIAKEDENGNILPPSQQPTKEEALLVFGQTDEKESCIKSFSFKRVGGKVMTTSESREGYTKIETPLLDYFWNGYKKAKGGKNESK